MSGQLIDQFSMEFLAVLQIDEKTRVNNILLDSNLDEEHKERVIALSLKNPQSKEAFKVWQRKRAGRSPHSSRPSTNTSGALEPINYEKLADLVMATIDKKLQIFENQMELTITLKISEVAEKIAKTSKDAVQLTTDSFYAKLTEVQENITEGLKKEIETSKSAQSDVLISNMMNIVHTENESQSNQLGKKISELGSKPTTTIAQPPPSPAPAQEVPAIHGRCLYGDWKPVSAYLESGGKSIALEHSAAPTLKTGGINNLDRGFYIEYSNNVCDDFVKYDTTKADWNCQCTTHTEFTFTGCKNGAVFKVIASHDRLEIQQGDAHFIYKKDE